MAYGGSWPAIAITPKSTICAAPGPKTRAKSGGRAGTTRLMSHATAARRKFGTIPTPARRHAARPTKATASTPRPIVSDSIAKTTCYMCACRCGIDVHLKDGKVRYIDGNRDHPVNRGVICGKGSAGIMQHYSPARLRKPLLRIGPRGSGEFREIEWDEALRDRDRAALGASARPIRRSSPSSPGATSRSR